MTDAIEAARKIVVARALEVAKLELLPDARHNEFKLPNRDDAVIGLAHALLDLAASNLVIELDRSVAAEVLGPRCLNRLWISHQNPKQCEFAFNHLGAHSYEFEMPSPSERCPEEPQVGSMIQGPGPKRCIFYQGHAGAHDWGVI